MISRTTGALFLACALSYGGSAIAGNTNTPGENQGNSVGGGATAPGAQLQTFNKFIHIVLPGLNNGEQGLGKFWINDPAGLFSCGANGPGATQAINAFFQGQVGQSCP